MSTDDRVIEAYSTFRNGFKSQDTPLPWGHLLPWIRDAMKVAYLQGTLDKPRLVERATTEGATNVGLPRPRLDRTNLEALFADHYWDSVMKDKDIILLHIKSVLDMAEKAR